MPNNSTVHLQFSTKSRIIMSKQLNIKEINAQNKDIIRFVVVVVVSHLFWKFTVAHPENLTLYDITWFGLDISAPFVVLTQHVATATHWLLSMFYDGVVLEGTRVIFPNGQLMHIVWACSGLKQMFIFTLIIICARGSWRNKLWFVPLGLLACHIYNIVRIAFLGWIVESHFELFDFFHEYITKYIFYGIIFLLWMWWNERFNPDK